jgi:Tol biopolymer transport system component
MRSFPWLAVVLVLCAAPIVDAASWRTFGTLEAVPGQTAENGSRVVAVAGNGGRWTLFDSRSADLVPGMVDEAGGYDVFVHDAVLGTTSLISHAFGQNLRASAEMSEGRAISDDGRFVLFESQDSTLAGGPQSDAGDWQIYLYDRTLGTSTLVSHSVVGAQAGDGDSSDSLMSEDGRRVFYASEAQDLVAGVDTCGAGVRSLFVFDRITGVNRLLSHAKDEPLRPLCAIFTPSALTPDGHHALASSRAELEPEADSRYVNTYLFDLDAATRRAVVRHGSVMPDATRDTFPADISDDGRYVLVTTNGNFYVAGVTDRNGSDPDVYLFDATDGAMRLLSHVAGDPLSTADDGTWNARFIADGRVILSTNATDLDGLDDDSNGWGSDLVLHDPESGEFRLLAHRAGMPGTTTADAGGALLIDRAETCILLRSYATDLVSGLDDARRQPDIFLADLLDGTLTLVSHRPGHPLTPGNGQSLRARVSSDCTRVVFHSASTDLATDDNNGLNDVFAWTRADRTQQLLSTPSAPAPVLRATNRATSTIAGSGDGRWLVLASEAGDFTEHWRTADAGDAPDGLRALLLQDRLSGEFTVLTPQKPEADYPRYPFDGGFFPRAEISRDGRFVAYQTLLDVDYLGDLWARQNVLVFDRVTGSRRIVTHTPGQPDSGCFEGSQVGRMTPDGRWLLFWSSCPDLVAGDGNHGRIYLYDTVSGERRRVERPLVAPSVPLGEGKAISDDGRFVLFDSVSALVAGVAQTGGLDVYRWDAVTGASTLISHPHDDALLRAGGVALDMSPDGRWVLFASAAADIVEGVIDSNGADDLFLKDMQSGQVRLVSHSHASATNVADAATSTGSLAGGGQRVVFDSRASNLTSGNDSNDDSDVFVWDRDTSATMLVSHVEGDASRTRGGRSTMVAVDSEIRRVSFLEQAKSTSGYGNAPGSLFVRDLANGELSFVAHGVPGESLGEEGLVQFSDAGDVLAFTSSSAGIVTGLADRNGTRDAFVFERSYTVTVDAGANGIVVPSTAQAARPGERITVTATADPGYRVEQLAGCDGMQNGSAYVTSAIGGDCVVTVRFVPGGDFRDGFEAR